MSSNQRRQVSRETLFNGALQCNQHDQGYRFSVDSILLANFPKIGKGETVLELGAGCGIIGLILCYRYPALLHSVTGIEIQSGLAELARSNIKENGFDDRFRLVHDDLRNHRELFRPESFSLVIANPPFYTSGSGRAHADSEANCARHQEEGGLEEFVMAAAYCVKNRGRVVFIFPAELSMHLSAVLQRNRLTPKIMELIYSYPESDFASLVLIESVKNGGVGCRVRAPFYLYQSRNGPYSERAELMFAPSS